MNGKKRALIFSLGLTCLTVVSILCGQAASEIKLLKGQTVYVPAYSHIYHGDREMSFNLAVTLSIRNTDQGRPINIVAVDYFDSEGKLVRSFLSGEVPVKPLGSKDYVVKESDKSGGSGANFIVRWKSEAKVTEPVIEAVMIGTQTQQGLSFTSRGQAIREDAD